MNSKRSCCVGLAFVLIRTLSAGAQTPVGTAFTYQGRLDDGGVSASGFYDFQLARYDAQSGGSQIGSTIMKDDVAVTAGIFTVSLDFGRSAFASDARWLQIGIRPGASTGAFTPLEVRQELTPTPNAVFSETAPWSGLAGVPAGFADGVDDDSGTVTSITAGTGLTGGTIGVDFGTSGTTAATGDHDHFEAIKEQQSIVEAQQKIVEEQRKVIEEMQRRLAALEKKIE